MGACYSKTGHEATLSPKHKSPHKKQNNGVDVKIEYTPVRPHEDDRLSQFVDNNYNHGKKSCDDQVTAVSTKENEKDNVDIADDGIDKNIPLIDTEYEGLKQEIGVATSDSGIESLSPNDTADVPIEASSSQPLNTSPPGPKSFHLTDIPERRDCTQCTCGGGRNRSSLTYGEFTSSKRNSDLIHLKPSLKKKGYKSDKKFRLSWKSTDSLDRTSSFGSSLDRCQSQSSDMFLFDELSICAPLATFDSVDFLGSTTKLRDKSRTNSYISYDSETFSFKFDFSALDVKKCDTAPTSPDKEENKVFRRQNSRTSTVSCENVLLDMSKRSSREIRHFDSEASLDLSSAFQSLQDVKTMQMDGKEVVVIDAELYSQVLEELASLKYKLSQLTDLIQLQSISGEDNSEVEDLTPLNSPRIRTSLNFSKS